MKLPYCIIFQHTVYIWLSRKHVSLGAGVLLGHSDFLGLRHGFPPRLQAALAEELVISVPLHLVKAHPGYHGAPNTQILFGFHTSWHGQHTHLGRNLESWGSKKYLYIILTLEETAGLL